MSRIGRSALMAAFLLIAVPAVAHAAGLPADCSSAAIPSGPAKGSIADAAFVPSDVSVSVGESGIGDGHTYDAYAFLFDGQDKSGEAMSLSVTVIVPKGAAPDGKLFRMLPTDDTDKQPKAGPGAPEVQGWSLEYSAKNIDTDFIDTVGSMRLELGRHAGKTLAGRIYLCVPNAGDSSLAGSFSATLQ